MESFLTLQGEGAYTGKNAFFLRLAGCDVGCVWCDVKESWTVGEEQHKSYDWIREKLKTEAKGNIVVVTGGEPCIYDLNKLTTVIKEEGKRTHIETSGAYEITGDWDWVTLSPKKFKEPVASSYQKCDELKVVVFHPSDIAWAQKHAEKIKNKESVRLLLQPEWSKKEKMTPLIIDFIYDTPEWGLSLQTHKYIGIE